MKNTYKHSGPSSSPHTSENSPAGTPETRLTAFSPEDYRTSEKVGGGPIYPKKSGPPTFSLEPAHGDVVGYTNSSNAKPGLPNANPIVFHLFGPPEISSGHESRDPFLSESANAQRNSLQHHQKLSPTASTFTPINGLDPRTSGFGQSSHTARQANAVASTKTGYLDVAATPIAAGSHGPHLMRYLNSVASNSVQPNGQSPSSKPTTPTKARSPFSTDNKLSRSLVIERISRKTSGQELIDFFNVQLFPSLKGLLLVELNSNGTVYLGFTDLRDTENAYRKAQSLRPDWSVQFVDPNQFAQKQKPGSAPFVSAYEGQVLISAHFSRSSEEFKPKIIHQLVQELLVNYGELKAYQKLDTGEPPFMGFRAEFFNTNHAKSAVEALNGFKIGGCSLSVYHYEPDLKDKSPSRLNQMSVRSARHDGPDFEVAFSQMGLGHQDPHHRQYPAFSDVSPYTDSSYSYLSPTGRSEILRHDFQAQWAPRYDHPGYTYPRQSMNAYPGPGAPYYPSYSRYGAVRGPLDMYRPVGIGQDRGPYTQGQHQSSPYSPRRRVGPRIGGRDHVTGHHNVVDVERIRRGLDVRTTIMLRNIPNKVDQAMLKQIVDETSFGKYDFMYLRIDFANNCNVGYAFINFEDPWFIIDFVNARAGLRWNRYNSDKVAEVSYATIQGKDCLVQKFRNSSVMLEHAGYRPKIFHTGTGPLAGQEDDFPGPDNPSKMRRSVENAEHVGLFAPRAGQHFRDEQRRRRSQYDRGTRLAELEDSYEYDFHDQPQQDYYLRNYEDDRYAQHSGHYDAPY
ncbi:MAG: hypothetical protein M1812_003858 [Candelaria pacifica]|nr:MAG: hypothetical protein M1812_003858 [Candelaria pacifica]